MPSSPPLSPVQDPRWTPHVTVAALVAQNSGGQERFLLVEEYDQGRLVINNPAGHLEFGESLLQAVVREVLEETAHDFTPTALLGVFLARKEPPQMPQTPANHADATETQTQMNAATEDQLSYLRFAFLGTVGAPVPGRALDAGIAQALWLTQDEIWAAKQAGRLRSDMVWQSILAYTNQQRYPLALLHTHSNVTAQGLGPNI